MSNDLIHYWPDCPDLDDDDLTFDAYEVTCDWCKAQGL
jgi:hypothetical protein